MQKVLNEYANPIGSIARLQYNEMLSVNEKSILEEADPKVTYFKDSNMDIVKFVTFGGDIPEEKRRYEKEEFNIFGNHISIPVEVVDYEVVDKRGKVTKKTAKYLNTTDTLLVAEVYEQFYKLAELLIGQEIVMKGLLPELTKSGDYIVDPGTGLPLVGQGYLENYFGLTNVANKQDRDAVNALSDIYRWGQGTMMYQVKTSKQVWSRIHTIINNGEIASFRSGSALDNIGNTDFIVNNGALERGSYFAGATTPNRPQFGYGNARSDLANTIVNNYNQKHNLFTPPAAMNNVIDNNIQPSVVNEPVQEQGPLNPVGNKKKK